MQIATARMVNIAQLVVNFRPTSVHFKSRVNGRGVPLAMFYTAFFGTSRSMDQVRQICFPTNYPTRA